MILHKPFLLSPHPHKNWSSTTPISVASDAYAIRTRVSRSRPHDRSSCNPSSRVCIDLIQAPKVDHNTPLSPFPYRSLFPDFSTPRPYLPRKILRAFCFLQLDTTSRPIFLDTAFLYFKRTHNVCDLLVRSSSPIHPNQTLLIHMYIHHLYHLRQWRPRCTEQLLAVCLKNTPHTIFALPTTSPQISLSLTLLCIIEPTILNSTWNSVTLSLYVIKLLSNSTQAPALSDFLYTLFSKNTFY